MNDCEFIHWVHVWALITNWGFSVTLILHWRGGAESRGGFMKLLRLSVHPFCQNINQTRWVVVSHLFCQHTGSALPALVMDFQCVLIVAAFKTWASSIHLTWKRQHWQTVQAVQDWFIIFNPRKLLLPWQKRQPFFFSLDKLMWPPPFLLSTYCLTVSELASNGTHHEMQNRQRSGVMAEREGKKELEMAFLETLRKSGPTGALTNLVTQVSSLRPSHNPYSWML